MGARREERSGSATAASAERRRRARRRADRGRAHHAAALRDAAGAECGARRGPWRQDVGGGEQGQGRRGQQPHHLLRLRRLSLVWGMKHVVNIL